MRPSLVSKNANAHLGISFGNNADAIIHGKQDKTGDYQWQASVPHEAALWAALCVTSYRARQTIAPGPLGAPAVLERTILAVAVSPTVFGAPLPCCQRSRHDRL